MTEYYRHGQHKYLVPAVAVMCADPSLATTPSLSVKYASFLGAVLRGLPGDMVAHYCTSMTMVRGVDVGFVLAVLHATGTPQARGVFDRLAVSLRRANARPLIAAGQHIASVPTGVPLAAWPMPYDDTLLSAAGAAWPPPRGAVYPWELSAVFGEARGFLDRHDWLLLSSTAVLEALWAGFYATGGRAYVERVVGVAAAWGEFAPLLPDGTVRYMLSLDTPLPEALVGPPAGGPGGRTADDEMRSVRAQVSRVAVCSLLHHTRRHPGAWGGGMGGGTGLGSGSAGGTA
jgi:hypothetical protein